MSFTFDSFLQRAFSATGAESQNEFAAILGINRSAITQARRKNAVPAKWLLTLYRRYGLNPDWLETGNGRTFLKQADATESEFQRVPKVKARLCAGGGSFEVGSEVEGYYSFRKEWLSSKGSSEKMVLMDIFGNSMSPELRDGDSVLIDESQKEILSGAMYAVGVEDTIMVKRVEKHPNRLVLLSDNTDYSPLFLSREEMSGVRIIGKVLWVCREFR